MSGPVLSVKGLARWAVVGDVTNSLKPAFRVCERIEGTGATVYRVSPYGKHEGVFTKLSEIPSDTKIDAVNLVVSPSVGVIALEEMKQRDIKYCFIQPGADGGDVLTTAAKLGITVQRGCVLMQDMQKV
mmetsp:Transcript_33196/g.48714  ORF Transcript_33196/g.48714 Transcript_33196/m.48714 type:complete len:129 (+) Transcript_33196:196-582(+)|eukprot:CAMPEP_0195510994 /NCGR_PEP_ID=MMETSP0794_2-20130614/3469_1 /TAXON_ID=515487 /ORGANISM="Stephanopyxis turris, Strain CCMP 815" /LENGTH=128 /DNA_ID=CAMNT_0040638523 /DNA_START=223 /DNA_END=609 /DNA_ORIENTATION=+